MHRYQAQLIHFFRDACFNDQEPYAHDKQSAVKGSRPSISQCAQLVRALKFPMLKALRKLILLSIAAGFLNRSSFLSFGATKNGIVYGTTLNVRRDHLVRFASAGGGFEDHTDTLRKFSPEQRLQHVAKLKEGQFVDLANKLTPPKEGTPRCLLHAIQLAADRIDVGIAGKDKGGSTRTKTAIKYSSDLDLNLQTTRNLTRNDRVQFKDALVGLLPRYTDGWKFVHMGKKCIKLKKVFADGGKREADIAFMNTTFDTGVVDRGENVAFFHDNPGGQSAVKVMKFCFLDVSGLCGFHIERLAVAVSENQRGKPTAKSLYLKMLGQLRDDGPQLKRVLEEAVEEVDQEDQDERRDKVGGQILKMRHVIRHSQRL